MRQKLDRAREIKRLERHHTYRVKCDGAVESFRQRLAGRADVDLVVEVVHYLVNLSVVVAVCGCHVLSTIPKWQLLKCLLCSLIVAFFFACLAVQVGEVES